MDLNVLDNFNMDFGKDISKDNVNKKVDSNKPVKVRKKKSIIIPHRKVSVIELRKPVISSYKEVCVTCPCRLELDSIVLLPCQQVPYSLYELAAFAVNKLRYPRALDWSEDAVAKWMAEEVGFPQYTECILDNHINGMRLLMFEDPSKLPQINIHYFEHIKIITGKIRKEYTTDFVRFVRSVGLPMRKLITYSTWFKSRTGPSWGIRQNWSTADLFRWMKILMPTPLHLDHWDLVWYQKPDFPKVMLARIEKLQSEPIPHYKPLKDVNNEFTLPRKFKILNTIPEDKQFIWLEHRPGSPVLGFLEEQKIREERALAKRKRRKEARKFLIKENSRLLPKKISTEGLRGKELVLARRLTPKQKFLPKPPKSSPVK